MSSRPFGEHLKREREMRGVSLDEIATATRISARYLEALENEEWDQLPGGVFNRGFIRAVARFLGLDEDSLITEYELEAKDNDHTHIVAVPLKKAPRNWRPIIGVVILVAFVAALGTGGWVVYRQYGARIAAYLHRQRATPAASSEPADRTSTAGGADDTGAASPVPGDSGTANAHPATDTADDKSTLELKMEAGKPAEVRVVADGKVAFYGHIEVDEVKHFRARSKLEITSSESSALVLELNGQTVPPIGAPGQAGSITLTRKDLKPAEGGTH
jgi:cytoskeletal protein RodZ